MFEKSWYGKNGFIWFFGIVENRMDPLKSGRVQVRCFSYHTEDITQMPTEHLPWTQAGLSPESSGISGIGNSPTGLKEGSFVFGFFLDGIEAQQPFILCSVPGIPLVGANSQKGFADPRTSLAGFPLSALTNAPTAFPRYLDEPDTNRLARAESLGQTINGLKRTPESIQTAQHVSTGLGSDASVAPSTLNQPASAYNAVYPFNSVHESESGHVTEIDDSPGAERIHQFHRKGTFYEIGPDGTKTTNVEGGQDYEVVQGNSIEHVKGQRHIVVDGQATIKANGMTIQIASNSLNIDVSNGSANIKISGDVNLLVGGNWNQHIVGNMIVQVDGNVQRTITGTLTDIVTGAVILQAPTVQHVTPAETITGSLGVGNGMSVVGGGGANATFNGPVQVNSVLVATGEITGNGITLSAHGHTGVETGPGTTGNPINL